MSIYAIKIITIFHRINKKTFLTYVKATIKLFPNETPGTYYSPYKRVGNTKWLPKGKWYDRYLYVKARLRKDKVLGTVSQCSLESEPSSCSDPNPGLLSNGILFSCHS